MPGKTSLYSLTHSVIIMHWLTTYLNRCLFVDYGFVTLYSEIGYEIPDLDWIAESAKKIFRKSCWKRPQSFQFYDSNPKYKQNVILLQDDLIKLNGNNFKNCAQLEKFGCLTKNTNPHAQSSENIASFAKLISHTSEFTHWRFDPTKLKTLLILYTCFFYTCNNFWVSSK